jgi:hypothetical protein
MTANVDRKRLRVTGNHRVQEESHVLVNEEKGAVTVVVTQAFGPKGDALVGLSDVTFDGFPALTLLVEAGGESGLLHLSPIHGDNRKAGFTDIKPGTRCVLRCPVSRLALDRIPTDDDAVEGDSETDYFAIYLTPDLSLGSIVAISDVWGHYHSRIVDNFELISLWAR